MQITRLTDYGLRVLIYLALRPGERIPAADVARAFRISQHHLMKVIRKLAAAGILRTYRGKRGGITLAQSPDRIRVGTVVRELEGELAVVDCVRPLCPAAPACRLKAVLDGAEQAFLAALDECTLAELVRQPNDRALRELLHIAENDKQGERDERHEL